MNIFNNLVFRSWGGLCLILLLIAGLPSVKAADVVLTPGYINGTVTIEGVTTNSINVQAYSGNENAQTSSNGSNYNLTVNVPQGISLDYTVYASAYSGNNNYFSFNSKTVTVSDGSTSQLDFYINPGTISGQVTLSGATLSYGYVYAYSYSGSDFNNAQGRIAADGSFSFPAQPNADIQLSGTVYDTHGNGYPLSAVTGVSVSAGGTVTQDWTVEAGTASISGAISLNNAGPVSRQYVYGYGPVNPTDYRTNNFGSYALTGLLPGDYTIYSYIYLNNYDDYFYFPYALSNGNNSSNQVSVAAGQAVNNPIVADAKFINGFVSLSGSKGTGNLNNGYVQVQGVSNTSSYGGYARDNINTSTGDFDLVVSAGKWALSNTYLSFYDSTLANRSSISIYDYGQQQNPFDLSTQGELNNVQLSYETGTITVNYSIEGGGLLSNPRLDANCQETNNNQLIKSVYGSAYRYSGETALGHVTFVGLPMNCNLTAYATVDGSETTFGALNVDILPGTDIVVDINAPVLHVTSPVQGTQTSDNSIVVSGTATDDQGVASVKVNGNSVAITSTNNPNDANEVGFTTTISLSSQTNSIQTVATDKAGKSASDTRKVYYVVGQALGIQPTSGAAAEPVNTATGNYYYQHTDLSLPGRGLPLVFTRTHNVQDATLGPLGSGWTHSYNLKLTEKPDGSVVIRLGDGHQESYDLSGGTYQPHDPGILNSLVKNGDGSFTLTQKNQTRMAFTMTGQLSTISDRDGNSLGFTHDGSGNLITITDTVGRNLTLGYSTGNRLLSITDPGNRSVKYAYDINGHLISDTDPNGGVQQYHYNADGVLDTITDRRGHILIANSYDSNQRAVSQTNGKGAVVTFAYDTPSVGKTSITDGRGNVTIHTHDALRRLISETDPLGHIVSYVYDANNNRTSITDKNGKVTAFTYDTQGNVLTKTDAQGNVTTLEYNSLNDPTRIVDALGQITTFAYDAKGNLNEVTDALGHKTKVTYDASGQPASVTNALGAVTQNTFNTQGNLIQVEDALGHKTTLTYDVIGQRTGMTDANGHAASFSYDNNGNLISVTDPLGHATSFSYDANNNRTGVTDPRGNATAFVYDANDLLSKATDPLGHFVQFAYDAADNRIKVTDPRGNITQYAYDAANRLTQVTDALNHATTLAYDANGNPLTQTNPLGHASSFAYDALNRLLNATDALGNKGFRSYDALGRLTQAKDAQGRITQYSYDALGRLTKVTDAKSGTVVYDYDALGNRNAVTDPNGHTTRYSYDALNRLTAKTDQLGQAYSYSYDPVGNRISLTDAKGQNLLYSYDGNNRLAAIAYPDATQVSFGYDAAGNRTQMIDKLGTSTYVFDALNRLDEHTDAFGKTVGNEYDPAGNRIALIYPDGKRVTYDYDPLNRMASVTDWLNGVTNYSYDAANNLASVLNPNNTKVSYGYDAAERLVNLANAKADTSVLASYALTLDAVGNRSGINRSEPLAPVFTKKTQALTFDNDNRLLTLDAAAVTHDPNGNLTAEPGKSFQYDFEDRLVAATGNQDAQFSYDGVGNRLVAIRSGQTTRYTLDVSGAMSNVLVENDGTGNPTAYYVHGLGLISRILPSGVAHYYHYDTIGSTVALSDAAGNVTDSYAYDPFGQVLNAQGTVANPFRYVGQFGVMQEGNGLQFMRARYYEAGVGRFLNKDALGNLAFHSFRHSYVYSNNNPISFADFNGMYSISDFGNDASQLANSFISTTVKEIVKGTVKGVWETAKSKINLSLLPSVIKGKIVNNLGGSTIGGNTSFWGSKLKDGGYKISAFAKIIPEFLIKKLDKYLFTDGGKIETQDIEAPWILTNIPGFFIFEEIFLNNIPSAGGDLDCSDPTMIDYCNFSGISSISGPTTGIEEPSKK